MPERDKGVDDARVEVEFLLATQIPPGRQFPVALDAGTPVPIWHFVTVDGCELVHSKLADAV